MMWSMHTVKYTIRIAGKKRYYAVSFDTEAEAMAFIAELSGLPGHYVVQPYLDKGLR